MSNLITAIEFAAFRDISKKINTEKVNESISLAQDSDLADILGDFFFDVLKNSAAPTYADLMDGSEFTYCDEVFIHKGIKALLADYAYSRHIYMINVNLTPFGAQSKFTDDSNGIDRATVRDISKQAQVDAGIKFQAIEKYILSEPILFKRYCGGKGGDKSFNSIKISKL